MTKNETLRAALDAGRLFAAMSAHNPLAAKLAEEAGFGGIWGSGEFQGKMAAAAAARRDKRFVVIARVEALIARQGQQEAIRRGLADEEAGADAILVHSKQQTPDEILAFVRAWPGRVPLVLVPTAYPQVTEADIAALDKVGVVIYGNHTIRAAVGAMRRVVAQIRRDGGLHHVDAELPSVKEIMARQGDQAMRAVAAAYLRQAREAYRKAA